MVHKKNNKESVFDQESVKAWYKVSKLSKRGRPQCYSDTAIGCLLLINKKILDKYRSCDDLCSNAVKN